VTDIHTTPVRGRPWVSSRKAAELIGRDHRTVQRMVRDGELAGGRQTSGRWFIYTDRPPFAAAAPPNLADENALLRARAEAAEEANRILLSTQASLLGALADYQQGTGALRQALETEQERSHLYHEAAQSYRRSADSLTTAVSAFRDLSAASTIPDDLSSMAAPPKA